MTATTSADEPLHVWCHAPFDGAALAALIDGVRPHPLLVDPAARGAALQPVSVAFGQPPPDLLPALPRLRWVQLSTAGYTTFDRPDVRAAFAARGLALTTSSAVYAEPCAQHALAFMLAEARHLRPSLESQLGDRGWLKARARSTSFLLRGTVALVGFGSIGRRLAELLGPFGLEVVGVRRIPRGDEPIAVVPLARADELLARADHVFDILPASADTARFFDGPRFAAIKRGAVFYNIGRGTTVDQDALAEALASGRLRAAYLDVTDPEPLPPAHPLWTARGCTITPHSAGGHADEPVRLVRHFLANLARHAAGQPLIDRVF
jgi:phosphoglycerate dehydrogenase-like enzyme